MQATDNMAFFNSLSSTPKAAAAGLSTVVYESLNFVSSGNLTVTGNNSTSVNIFKTGGTAGWDNQAYVNTAYTAPCTIEFNKQAAATDNSASYAMISWNADPLANASYDTLDYASYPYFSDGYYVYHNGTGLGPYAPFNTSLKFYVVYGVDGTIKHYNGSTLLYSVVYGSGPVYLDSSYYSVNGTFGGFSNIRVTKRAWNGRAYF